MGIIGITQNKIINILFKISKWFIYSWIVISTILFLLVFNEYNLNNYLTTFLVCAIVFIPLYLVGYTTIYNTNIKLRVLISSIALIPIIISYTEFINHIQLVKPNIFFSIFIFLVYLMLNYSILIKPKSYVFLMAFSLLNSYFYIFLYIIYQNNIVLITNELSLVYPLILIIILLSINFAFFYHICNLMLERIKDARNS